jgi:hypothetical protein
MVPRARPALRRALPALCLAGLVALGGACKTPLTWGTFSEDACGGAAFSLPEAFNAGFDYAEVRLTQGPQPDAKYTVESSAGEKCKGAKARDACVARVAEAQSSEGFSNGSHGRMPGHRYVVATRGDEVVIVTDPASAGKALAPIDRPAKAAAVVAIATTVSPACKASVRRAGGGYEVYVNSTSCFGPREILMRVEADGASRVLRQESKPATCVGRAGVDEARPEG